MRGAQKKVEGKTQRYLEFELFMDKGAALSDVKKDAIAVGAGFSFSPTTVTCPCLIK